MSTEADPLSTRPVKEAEDRRLTRLSSPRQGQPALHKSSRSTCWQSAAPAGQAAVSQHGRKSPNAPAFLTLLLLLLLLLSRFSCVQLCATPETAALQAPCPWDSPGKNTGVGCHFLLRCMGVRLSLRYRRKNSSFGGRGADFSPCSVSGGCVT